MDETGGYYTISAYMKSDGSAPTAAMEDYLEMIARMRLEDPEIRIRDLSRRLHVRPSSASKMVSHLREAGYLAFEKYGLVRLTEQGLSTGMELLNRHRILAEFFQLLNQTEDALELVEKIEHFIDPKTVQNLNRLAACLREGSLWPPASKEL